MTPLSPLELKLMDLRRDLEQIIITEGIDKGVILKSWESPTEWDATQQAHIYKHENFSELGDALIALYEKMKE